jgi:apolipoprotein D and lipocalin family protein
MERTVLIQDIESLKKNSSSDNVRRISNKYKMKADSASELIKALQQYTSYIEQRQNKNNRTIVLELEDNLDLEKYQGLWYNAARIPQPFDMDTPWETAEYKIIDAKTVSVTNTAYMKDGRVRGKIEGTAQVMNNDTSTLYVSFPTGQPKSVNPEANYLIHETDYETYAVVGSYDGSNLYILSRTRPMSISLYRHILRYVEKLGYDITLLQKDYGAVEYEDDCIVL